MFTKKWLLMDPNKNRFTGKDLIFATLPYSFTYHGLDEKNPAKIDTFGFHDGIITGKDLCARESSNLLHSMVCDVGPRCTTLWMAGIQRVANFYIMNTGCTMGMDNYEMTLEDKEYCEKKIKQANEWCLKQQGYDMRRSNNIPEFLIQSVLERCRELVLGRLMSRIQFNCSIPFFRRNGTKDLIDSKAKGKKEHLMAMGAIVGQQMPFGGRVIGNVAHWNKLINLPEAHGFIFSNYRDGLSPNQYWDAAKGGREGLVATADQTPVIGYFQRRAGICMADLVTAYDGSVRDANGAVVQILFGEDGCDPSVLQTNPFHSFFTPFEHADAELKSLQIEFMKCRTEYYRNQTMPKHVSLPTRFSRLLLRLKTVNPDQPSIQDEKQIKAIVSAWFKEMQENDWLIQERNQIGFNLNYNTMYKDFLSLFHLKSVLQINRPQLSFILENIKKELQCCQVTPKESVGMIAAQSIGEPSTQTSLNTFHKAGDNQSAQNLASSSLDDAVKACKDKPKKNNFSCMRIFLKPPMNKNLLVCKRFAKLIKERKLQEFVQKISVIYYPDLWTNPQFENLQESMMLFRNSMLEETEKDRLPILVLHYNKKECEEVFLSMMEIEKGIYDYFKRTIHIISSGSFSQEWYSLVFFERTMFQHSSFYSTIAKSIMNTCLFEVSVRGICKIPNANVYPVSTETFNEKLNVIEKEEEWCIVTNGSNFEALITMPYVHFERCTTNYIHDVYKMMGISATRNWLDRHLEELIRSMSSSKVDVHHTKLIADIMTRTGLITPVNRNGLKNSTTAVLRLFFENILDNIKTGSLFSQKDDLKGTSENVLMSMLPPNGTAGVRIVDPNQKTKDSKEQFNHEQWQKKCQFEPEKYCNVNRIAEQEFAEKMIPLKVRRKRRDGSVEDVSIQNLVLPEEEWERRLIELNAQGSLIC